MQFLLFYGIEAGQYYKAQYTTEKRMKEFLQKHKQYLLTGVSYVIPFIACGGILIALSLTYAFHFHLLNDQRRADPTQGPWFVQNMLTIGVAAFTLFSGVSGWLYVARSLVTAVWKRNGAVLRAMRGLFQPCAHIASVGRSFAMDSTSVLRRYE